MNLYNRVILICAICLFFMLILLWVNRSNAEEVYNYQVNVANEDGKVTYFTNEVVEKKKYTMFKILKAEDKEIIDCYIVLSEGLNQIEVIKLEEVDE